MKFTKRTNAIILGVVAVGLLLGMIATFTPGLREIGQQVNQPGSQTVLLVNNQPISELDVSRLQQGNPIFNVVQEGPVGDDLQLLLLDQLITNSLVRQAAQGQRVSSGEVREAVQEFREAQGVAGSRNDQQYLAVIARAGYSDGDFRRAMEQQLREQKYIDSLNEGVSVSDEEAQVYFESNRDAYASEPRIRAREMVVEDEALAGDLYARALADEDFAALAREFSLERAEQGGALGAAEGSTDPTPVGRAALPTEAANAAFALEAPGLTEVVAVGARYYIVQVEEYLAPAPQPFEEVADRVRDDALEVKRAGVLESALDQLRADAQITVPEGSAYSYEDRVVATVGEREIAETELARTTYGNQQVQQFLSPDSAELIINFFKPSALEQLINQNLAILGAQRLEVPFIGSEPQIAQSALGYVARDAEATDDEVSAYYDENQASYRVSASAVVNRFEFDDQAAASEFRDTLLDQQELSAEALQETAETAGGRAEELGTVNPGQLEDPLDAALFEQDDTDSAFAAIPALEGREVSEVLTLSELVEPVGPETGGAALPEEGDDQAEGEAAQDDEAEAEAAADEEPETRDIYVVLVATRTAERVRPLEEVRAQVQQTVLNNERQTLREAWLEELRAEFPVDNRLETEAGADTGGAAFPGLSEDALELIPEGEIPPEIGADDPEELPEPPVESEGAPAEETPPQPAEDEQGTPAQDTPDEEQGEQ